MTNPEFEPLPPREDIPQESAIAKSTSFFEEMRLRRSVRDFAPNPVPREIIENAIAAAGRAPCGANQQPWHFVAVQKAETKRQIRIAAEKEEQEFYQSRAPNEWLNALAPIGTDEHKPFLEVAPWLIAIFAQPFGVNPDGSTTKHYYVSESVGIATGILITALHRCGLATLTHTPSPMKFLGEILGRPKHERAFLLLVVGHASQSAMVPAITKKTLAEISTFVE